MQLPTHIQRDFSMRNTQDNMLRCDHHCLSTTSATPGMALAAQALYDTAITPQVLLYQLGHGNYRYAALLLLYTASIAAGAIPTAGAPSPRLRKLSSRMNSVTMSRYTCTSDFQQNCRARSALTAGNPWRHPKAVHLHAACRAGRYSPNVCNKCMLYRPKCHITL